MSNNKQQTKKIPRPTNCFLAFRLEKQGEILARCPGANHRDLSKIIAKWWRETSEQEKEPFREKARLAKIEHAKLHPGYKYAPNKRPGHKPRKYIRRVKDTFTSRSAENNQMMQMFYANPKALEDKTSQKDIRLSVDKKTKVKSEKTLNDTISNVKCELSKDIYKPIEQTIQFSNQNDSFMSSKAPAACYPPSFFNDYFYSEANMLPCPVSTPIKIEDHTLSYNSTECALPLRFNHNLPLYPPPMDHFPMSSLFQDVHSLSPMAPMTTYQSSPLCESVIGLDSPDLSFSPINDTFEYCQFTKNATNYSCSDIEYSPDQRVSYCPSKDMNDECIMPETCINPMIFNATQPLPEIAYSNNWMFNSAFPSYIYPI
ncbi:hypothetical protein BDF14DRAFT_1750518 [Spinellus fusiger]|nr:hypothetical protein BDF14DRAFT_1750518 [Spinellus fusiger]